MNETRAAMPLDGEKNPVVVLEAAAASKNKGQAIIINT
jgi:hypothetical protein